MRLQGFPDHTKLKGSVPKQMQQVGECCRRRRCVECKRAVGRWRGGSGGSWRCQGIGMAGRLMHMCLCVCGNAAAPQATPCRR